MKTFIKNYWKTLLFFTLAGLIGGFFVGVFMMDSYPEEIVQQLQAQGINNTMLWLGGALQYGAYALFLGAAGIFFAKKTGLWAGEKSITRKPLVAAIVISVIGGLVLIYADLLFFSRYIPGIELGGKPTLAYILGSVITGGIVEEVMLRLFMMSLIVFILHKLFERKAAMPSVTVLVIANVIAALLFAAGHLPVTFATIGNSPMILFRCFLLNGGFGLAFGWLYRKFGLRYAMIAHGGCHVVSKLILLIIA